VLFNWDFPVEHEINNNNNNNNNNTLPFETKVRGGCELPGADMQKPYAPTICAKIWAGKNKNRPVSGFFLQKSPMSKL
jgi:hypothetical protein